jgi:hypothetical protein
MLKPLEYSASLNGARDGMVRWRININGQTFDFGEGVGHFVTGPTPHKQWKEPKEVNQAIAEKIATGSNAHDIESTIANFYKATKRLPSARWDARSGTMGGIGRVLPPELDSVLYCLVSDAEAENMGHADWCDNFGYEVDSRKGLEIYLECQNIAQKLRKAGVNIEAERERLADY